jgi:hypothetical protein
MASFSSFLSPSHFLKESLVLSVLLYQKRDLFQLMALKAGKSETGQPDSPGRNLLQGIVRPRVPTRAMPGGAVGVGVGMPQGPQNCQYMSLEI